MAKNTKSTSAAARRMQSAAAKNPTSKTAATRADRRVQSAAAKNAAKAEPAKK